MSRFFYGVAMVLVATASAQVPTRGWVEAFPTWMDIVDGRGRLLASTNAGRIQSALVDERGEMYCYLQSAGVHEVTYQPPHLIFGGLINAGLWGSVHADRSRLLVVHDYIIGYQVGSLAFVEKTAPYRATTFPTQFAAGRAAYDGRNLYWMITVDGTSPYHLFGLDTRRFPLVPRPIAALPVRVWTRPQLGITIGPDGKILLLDDSLWLVDPETGAMTALSPPPPDPLFYWPSGIDTKPTALAYDPWTGTVMAAVLAVTWSFSAAYSQTYGSGTWALWAQYPLIGFSELQSTSPRPFEPFGLGCDNATGRDAKLGWTGLSAPGRTFSITLRDAEPNGLGVIWLGLSETWWLLPLPLDLGPYGAPGCSILVASDDPLVVVVGNAGKAARAFQVPQDPALVGMDVFCQAASTSSTNALGVTTSDAMLIRIRQ
ncbi:MAG: hypothetical protein IPK26_31065 [Planctomycetes bacterium]|nr:hypothetical protein [Planctomycetota bacterium]